MARNKRAVSPVWYEDEELCPYGHPQVVCRVTRSKGKNKNYYICAIKRIEEHEAKQGETWTPNFRRSKEEMQNRLSKYGTTWKNSSRKYTIHLRCGHLTYQKTTNFTVFEKQYCYKCEDWHHITKYIHPNGSEIPNPDYLEK